MFTGLIEAIGIVSVYRPHGEEREIAVACPTLVDDIAPGDSVSVSGTCLTAEKIESGRFWARVQPQTVRTTTLSIMRVGQRVNLERALRVGDRLGGHFVLGHVDGVGEVAGTERQSGALVVRIAFPHELSRYIAPKGSICIDGVSLTVAELTRDQLTASLVKETQERTTLGDLSVGQKVNLETDILAKHLAVLVEQREGATSTEQSSILMEFLQDR
jgi:riboflavin synthase